jgi:dephospho-CoA kinase
MNKPWLIGIGGTNASGKDWLAQYLVEKHGYLFVSTSDILREEAMKRYGDIARPTLFKVGNELRSEEGAGVLVAHGINKFKAGNNQAGLVSSSIRTKGEVDLLKANGGVVLFIDADPKIRYERIKLRQRADDIISYEQFLAEQQAEWHESDDPAKFSIKTVKENADYFIENNSTFDDFASKIEEFLAKFQ